MVVTNKDVKISFDLVPEGQVDAALKNDYTRIDWTGRSTVNINKTTNQIRESIAQGIREGQDYSQMANNVSDRLGKSASDMRRIARTEGHRSRSQGQLDALNFAHEKGLNLEKEWLSALDDRTRDSHSMMDGQTVKMNERFTSPLTGAQADAPGMFGRGEEDINCRCSMVGVTPGERFEYRRYPELGNAPTSYIDKYQTYAQWAKDKGIKPHLYSDGVEPVYKDYSEVGPLTAFDVKKFTDDVYGSMQEMEDMFALKLTNIEKTAVRGYTHGGDRSIQLASRLGVKSGMSKPALKESLVKVKNINSAIKKTSIKQNIIVHRGSDSKQLDSLLKRLNPEDLVGKVIKDKGFVSTSLDATQARTFDSKYLFKIYAPENIPKSYISPISRYSGEHEVLLGSNRKFRILSIEPIKVEGKKFEYIINLEVIK